LNQNLSDEQSLVYVRDRIHALSDEAVYDGSDETPGSAFHKFACSTYWKALYLDWTHYKATTNLSERRRRRLSERTTRLANRIHALADIKPGLGELLDRVYRLGKEQAVEIS
jgi:hypothetical protein